MRKNNSRGNTGRAGRPGPQRAGKSFRSRDEKDSRGPGKSRSFTGKGRPRTQGNEGDERAPSGYSKRSTGRPTTGGKRGFSRRPAEDAEQSPSRNAKRPYAKPAGKGRFTPGRPAPQRRGRFAEEENNETGRRPSRPQTRGKREFDRPDRSEKRGGFRKSEGGDTERRTSRPQAPRGKFSRGSSRPERTDRRGKFDRNDSAEQESYSSKPAGRGRYAPKSFDSGEPGQESRTRKPFSPKSPREKTRKTREEATPFSSKSEAIRLNKFIANAGICSRREADEYIKSGVVMVNGKVVTELGFKVSFADVVRFGERTIRPEKPVYILLNKPKDHITTTDDPEGRKKVTDLIQVSERVFPVGRLDRNTTGVLLLTNDGDLAERLMHPKYEVKKVYLATLDKRLSRNDMDQLLEGVVLEDGRIAADALAYVGDDKKEIGVEIHSGRNRIIHRMFEHLGYKVEKLDRTSYAGITKQSLKKGAWRFLTPEELMWLKRAVSLKGKY